MRAAVAPALDERQMLRVVNLRRQREFADWLRQQIAAEIFDYIDAYYIPTDMGDVIPTGYTYPVPVIGCEKTPDLVAVEGLYEALHSTWPSPPVAWPYSAT